MSTPAKTISQLEASVASLDQTASMRGDIEGLFVTLRSQLDIDSGLPDDSPLRDGTEPEAAEAKAKKTAALEAENQQIEEANQQIDQDNAGIAPSAENDQIDADNAVMDKANAKVDKAAAKAKKP